MERRTLKINGQTVKYEIKVQGLKDTSWMKPHYLARFFCVKSIKQPQFLLTNWLLFCLIFGKEEWKMDCAENESVALTVYYWNWTMFPHI